MVFKKPNPTTTVLFGIIISICAKETQRQPVKRNKKSLLEILFACPVQSEISSTFTYYLIDYYFILPFVSLSLLTLLRKYYVCSDNLLRARRPKMPFIKREVTLLSFFTDPSSQLSEGES